MIPKDAFVNSICGSCAHVDVCSSIKDNRQKCGFYLEERPQWIPCSERLPEHGGYFLITNIDELVRVDFFRKSTNDFDNYSAIAWMELPKPYKEEGEAE